MNLRKYWHLKPLRLTLIVLSVLLFFRFGFLAFCEPTEIGIVRNLLSGQTWSIRGGWHFKYPWVIAQLIDTRPMLVTVDSAGHGYSAKLVQFVPEEWASFVRTEGFWLWWWANRLSFNSGYRHEHRGMKDILRGYAYGKREYPFLRIISEFGEQ
jgi:hypothetical protein